MPSEHLLALGDYRFALDTASYQELTRSTEWRWKAQERIGREPARQYIGKGNEHIDLSGVLYPSFRGGTGQVDAMRTEADLGAPLRLVTGTGRVLGLWVIERVEETQATLFADGTPRRVSFRLRLAYYGEDTGRTASTG